MDGTTIGAAFAGAVSAHGDRPFLSVPAHAARAYLPSGFEISYGEAGRRIEALAAVYREAGYGLGHRVATLLENHPDHILHKLALNRIGACIVPINPDYRAPETAYLIEHSQPDLVVTLGAREAQVREALAKGAHRPPVIVSDRFASSLTKARRPADRGDPQPETPASVLYTSGTTGRPKGCVLSHGYEVAAGARYAALGGLAALRPGQDRIYNPLPLYHANSGVFSLFGAILTGNCQIQPDRFHPGALVARSRRDQGHRRALPRHHRRHAAQPADGCARESAQRALRRRGRRRAAAPSGDRAALRLSPDRTLGHDRDGALPGGQPRAAPGRHARLRAGNPRGRSARGRRPGTRPRRRAAGRAAVPPFR